MVDYQEYQHIHDRFGSPEGDEREESAEKIFEEIMDDGFSNVRKNINLHIQKTQWDPNRK